MPDEFTEKGPADPIVGDVLALRSFRFDQDSQTLGGLSYRQEVAPGVNLAQCGTVGELDGHSAPHEGCTCGWYAYDEKRLWVGPPRGALVSAIVRLSGRIIVCERGLKAEGMEVIAVAGEPLYADQISASLPDVEVFYDQETMLKKHPLQRLPRGDEGNGMGAVEEEVTPNSTPSSRARKMPRVSVRTVVRYAVPALMAVAFTLSLLVIASGLFPPGSLGGFGALVPLALLVVLSPVISLRRSSFSLIAYLALLTYGIAGSAEGLSGLVESSRLTGTQVGVIGLVVYAVPLALLLRRILKPSLGYPAPAPVAAGAVSVGAIKGSAVLGVSGMGRTAFQRKSLPKKVKSVHVEGGNTAHGSKEEGDQHG